MRSIKQLLVALVVTTLAACGGGGTLDSGGDGGTGGGTGGTTPVFSLSVALSNANGDASTALAQATPLTVTATLTATNNGVVSGRLIEFSLSNTALATFGNTAGTAITNADGVATITLLAGGSSGAGVVTASYNDTSAEAAFESAGDGGEQVDVVVGSVSLLADTVVLGTGASSKVELTALVRDSSNVVIPGVRVAFASDSGELVEHDGVTAANGTAKATLTTQTDKNNRDIVLTATVGQQTSQLIVAVSGTSIEVAAPSSVVLNDTTLIDVFLTDSDDIGIANTEIEVVSALGNTLSDTSPATVGSAGKATFTYTAVNSGVDTLTVAALGAVSTITLNVSADEFAFVVGADEAEVQEVNLNTAHEVAVEWLVNGTPKAPSTEVTFNTTRGEITNVPNVEPPQAPVFDGSVTSKDNTDGDGVAKAAVLSRFAGFTTISATGGEGTTAVSTKKVIEFVSKNPTKVEVQSFPAQVGAGESSAIRAVVRDNDNNPVKGEYVIFSLQNAAGGVLSSGVALTNSQGIASTVFTADGTTGAGVDSENLIVRAALEDDNLIFDETDIAVGKRTLFFRFGTGNVITKPSASTYAKEFSVIVTDSSGNPVPNQALNVAVVPTGYRKGIWVASPPAPAAFKVWVPQVNANCENEDANLNGVLDPLFDVNGDVIPGTGEDLNGDGQLTPGNRASVPATVTSDVNGIATFNITYFQDVATWLDVRLQVSGFSAGTENVTYSHYSLPVAADDVTTETSPPPANPFGAAFNCATAN
ncbi:Ig-like domain-containing protein [Rheinheimera nanhaiensis]|uniref:Ig-like protein n=1 Tax=Rheinheimera nanhaiensis E407-8 TaxID=562729 RepID=I1DX20_9GAMM|nr:Ig-like domain-containing protein [Rheinheimera nanhaiensis]GAB58598.1 Ig-like protein [Rheinheimera nanhaiensis E407-8]